MFYSWCYLTPPVYSSSSNSWFYPTKKYTAISKIETRVWVFSAGGGALSLSNFIFSPFLWWLCLSKSSTLISISTSKQKFKTYLLTFLMHHAYMMLNYAESLLCGNSDIGYCGNVACYVVVGTYLSSSHHYNLMCYPRRNLNSLREHLMTFQQKKWNPTYSYSFIEGTIMEPSFNTPPLFLNH